MPDPRVFAVFSSFFLFFVVLVSFWGFFVGVLGVGLSVEG